MAAVAGGGAAELEGCLGGDGLNVGNAANAVGPEKFAWSMTHFDGDFLGGFDGFGVSAGTGRERLGLSGVRPTPCLMRYHRTAARIRLVSFACQWLSRMAFIFFLEEEFAEA